MTNKSPNHLLLRGTQTGPKSEVGKLRNSMSCSGIYRMRMVEIKQAMLELGFDPRDKKVRLIKEVIMNWLRSRNSEEIKEILEIEAILEIVKNEMMSTVLKKSLEKKQLNQEEMQKLKFLVDNNARLYTIKHGTTQTIRTIDFKDVMDSFWIKMEKHA